MSSALTFREVFKELRPYPGRGWMTMRIVLAVLLATVLVMSLRIDEGWLSLYFSFVFAKPTTKGTFMECLGVLFISVPVVMISLIFLRYASDPAWLRLLVLSVVLFGAFFLAKIMYNGDVPRNLTIIFAMVLTLPDVYPFPHLWVRGTFKLFPVVLVGVVPIMLTTLIFRPERNWSPAHRPKPPKMGIVPDAFTNPAHKIYALKCTFAAMSTYFIYTILSFQAIQTAMMTCLILALPTTQEIIHKTWLRLSGAVIGSCIAFVSAICIIPQSNSIAILLLTICGGSAIAAWVAMGSSRIAYAGWQIALVQFMLVTHSFGPSLDLSILKDRVIGILLGNVMMGITFKYLFPEKPIKMRQLQKILPLLCIGLFTLLFTGCQNTEKLAPESPSKPWHSPQAEHYRLPPQFTHPKQTPVQADHEYTLSELATLAQENNPKTRIAWEQARAAAATVGAVNSSYYPQLSIVAAAGYQHLPLPLPKVIFPKGYFYSDMAVIMPELQVDWLLWDFGRREALARGAREETIAQNFAFNAVHQELLFSVCQAYYKLVSIRTSLNALAAAKEDAILIENAAVSAKKQGFATETEVLQAKQQVAQIVFDLSAQEAIYRKAQIDLAETVGLDPREPLRVRDLTDIALPENFAVSVEAFVDKALSERPDLRASVAALRAADENIKQIEAQAGPTIGITGSFGPIYSAFNADNTGWISAFQPQYGAAIAMSLPVFDGFRRQQQTIAARAKKRQLEASIMEARNSAVRQVWEAYTDFENARRSLNAAEALLAASEASKASTMASFKHGFATITDLQTQQTLLTKARDSYQQSRTSIFLSASLLQFATGQLTVETIAQGPTNTP